MSSCFLFDVYVAPGTPQRITFNEHIILFAPSTSKNTAQTKIEEACVMSSPSAASGHVLIFSLSLLIKIRIRPVPLLQGSTKQNMNTTRTKTKTETETFNGRLKSES
ncbi:predicted protein [Sclerotinia sclerotiorum 1980 UF-70]|uniref:Uncharacterized protein n=1 Tax=Sclerotinia sclerotiorum (strain ATCC 18683 / 1980 / Ss-1) TaxID=665079 RepID=A7ETD9_SCLS1|nr:predicted protein [Sclerotinia sclerotiorum 1980 UF-70]EDN92731.1 predicted protein [Sclerotinia sclerotiorum 1980 UF-70]